MISRTIDVIYTNALGEIQAASPHQPAWDALVAELVAADRQSNPTPTPFDRLFTARFDRKHIAVVSVSQGRYRILLLNHRLYRAIPDPFAIEAMFPFDWSALGDLPPCEWPNQPLPQRTVKLLMPALKSSDSHFYLGGAQALVDSVSIIVPGAEPPREKLQQLWQMLPSSIQLQTMLSTWNAAFDRRFQLQGMPQLPDALPKGTMSAEQVSDYPEGRYEYELQLAIDHDDQPRVDQLLSRRSSREVINQALMLLALVIVFAIGVKWLSN
jgi:hypothetical protein